MSQGTGEADVLSADAHLARTETWVSMLKNEYGSTAKLRASLPRVHNSIQLIPIPIP